MCKQHIYSMYSLIINVSSLIQSLCTFSAKKKEKSTCDRGFVKPWQTSTRTVWLNGKSIIISELNSAYHLRSGACEPLQSVIWASILCLLWRSWANGADASWTKRLTMFGNIILSRLYKRLRNKWSVDIGRKVQRLSMTQLKKCTEIILCM